MPPAEGRALESLFYVPRVPALKNKRLHPGLYDVAGQGPAGEHSRAVSGKERGKQQEEVARCWMLVSERLEVSGQRLVKENPGEKKERGRAQPSGPENWRGLRGISSATCRRCALRA
jgi:hypothetical protein